jgi:hypothetical protein
MGRGCIARRRPGGGEGIQALRRSRARVTRAVLAGAALVGPVVYVAVAADRAAALVAAIGGLGVAFVTVGAAFGIAELLPLGIAAVGVDYGVFLALGDDTVQLGVPLIAAALIASGELAYSALEPPLVPASPAIRLGRALRSIGLVVGSAAAAALVLFVAVADIGDAAGLRLIGLGAAVGAVAMLAYLARAGA